MPFLRSGSLPMEGSSMLITSEYVQSGGRGLKIMFRCLAIDDEPLALKQLVAYISKVQFLELAAQCQSALEAREFLENDTVDAIFCDINMPDLNGMDFVKSLAVPPLVVFTTAYSEYAVEGFRVNAVDYLLKPFGFQEFQRAAQRLLERKMVVSPLPFPKEEADTLFLKTDNRIVNVNISDIRYIEAMSEYLKVWLDSQPKPVITLLSMKKIEERTFFGCRSLKNIEIGKNVTEIEMEAFRSCDNLETIEIPDKVATVGSGVFTGCKKLKTITLPDAMRNFGHEVFAGCTALKTVNSHIKNPSKVSFFSYGEHFPNISTITLNVPVGTKDAYEALSPWNEFKTIVEKEGL